MTEFQKLAAAEFLLKEADLKSWATGAGSWLWNKMKGAGRLAGKGALGIGGLLAMGPVFSAMEHTPLAWSPGFGLWPGGKLVNKIAPLGAGGLRRMDEGLMAGFDRLNGVPQNQLPRIV